MHCIEPATLADLPQLADLLAELFTAESDFQPDRTRQLRGLRHIIERPEIGCILVARDGGDILGMVNLLFTISTAEGGPVALLEDLIVRSTHRGQGFGPQLLQHAIQAAQARGLSRITVLTDRDNAKAIRLYGKHGFKASGMLPMRLHLNGN
jgi:ribosomal protein S18 acetylase RimI-like enzyme